MARFWRFMGLNTILDLRSKPPSCVLSLTLEGFSCVEKVSCTGFQDGASHVFPDAFEPYRDHIPVKNKAI